MAGISFYTFLLRVDGAYYSSFFMFSRKIFFHLSFLLFWTFIVVVDYNKCLFLKTMYKEHAKVFLNAIYHFHCYAISFEGSRVLTFLHCYYTNAQFSSTTQILVGKMD
jgi:hypothetical protein